MGVWRCARVSLVDEFVGLTETNNQIRYIAPFVEDWWFVWLANSQWRFPAALQILSVTGLPGLSFILMLANVAITALVWKMWRTRQTDWIGAAAFGVVVAIIA